MTTSTSTSLDVASLPTFPATWTAPSSCFATNNFYIVLLGSGYFSNMYGTPTPVLTGIWPTGDCFPPSSTPRVPYVTDGGCPAGYTLACATAGPDYSGKPMSTVTCCPSVTDNVFSFMCRDNEYGCHATATSGAVWTGVITDISLPTPTEQPVTHTPNSAEGCEAWGIKLISIAPQTSTTSASTNTGASAASQTSTSSTSTSGTADPAQSTSTSASTSSSSSLSGGAIAGIAIGVVAALALLALVAFLLYRRRRRQGVPSSSSAALPPPHQAQQQQPDVWPPEPKMTYHGGPPGPGPQPEPVMLDSRDLSQYPNPRADTEVHMLGSERERWEMEG